MISIKIILLGLVALSGVGTVGQSKPDCLPVVPSEKFSADLPGPFLTRGDSLEFFKLKGIEKNGALAWLEL